MDALLGSGESKNINIGLFMVISVLMANFYSNGSPVACRVYCPFCMSVSVQVFPWSAYPSKTQN